MKGKYKIPKNPPFIMGFEASGVVAEVGSQVPLSRQAAPESELPSRPRRE